MNVLFVNYGDFTTNSLNHIGGFANTLSAMGHACAVAVPKGRETIEVVRDPLFIPLSYAEALERPACFPDGRGADVIHAWTPRECVRRFTVAYQARLEKPARLIVHLEDNERHLLEAYTRRSLAELRKLDADELLKVWPDALSHPLRGTNLLRLADAVTVIEERLAEFVQEGVPTHLLRPGTDPHYAARSSADALTSLRKELGLARGERVLVFTGSTTFANEPEMRDLYLAVAMLNSHGTPTRLIRTGFTSPQFLASLPDGVRKHVVDLGFIEKRRLPGLLQLADALVQPGRAGAFNDYRLPSKLPEFFASGRPVILPASNIGLLVRDGVDALVLPEATPETIAAACMRLFNDVTLAATLGENGASFAAAHFDLARNTAGLLDLYQRANATPSRTPWSTAQGSDSSDVGLLAASQLPAAESTGELRDLLDQVRLLEADHARLVRAEAGWMVERREAALTKEHANNLEQTVATLRRELEQSVSRLQRELELSRRHGANMESMLADARRDNELARTHAENLAKLVADAQRALAHAHRKIDHVSADRARARTEADQLRHTVAKTTQELVDSHRRLEHLTEELSATRNILTQRSDKIRAMQSSFSWRATSPLRSLRRAFFDKPAPPSPARVPAVPAASTPTTADTVIFAKFVIDEPREWTDLQRKRLTIRGWALRTEHAPLPAIRARSAGAIFQGASGEKRVDIQAAHGEHPHAAHAGFTIDVRLTGDESELTIETEAPDGTWHPAFQTVLSIAPGATDEAPDPYTLWMRTSEDRSAGALRRLAETSARWEDRPLISIVVPVHNTPEQWLRRAVESVRAQTYDRWELCLADDASPAPHVRSLLEEFAASDARIKVCFRAKNGHISAASNSALELATGEWIALLDHDDELAPDALHHIVATLRAHPETDLVYSDEDKIDTEGRRSTPYFKPDFLPDLFTGQNFVSHLAVYRASIVREIGGFRVGLEGSQDWDLALRFIERSAPARIRHVPRVLYHWRAIPGSTALLLSEKNYPVEAARKALTEHFKRRGETVELSLVPGGHWRVKFPTPEPAPRVSLVIPTRNGLHLIQRCVESILEKTTYPAYEIIIVDNGSDEPDMLQWLETIANDDATHGPVVRVLRDDSPFNYSALNNRAVAQARGEFVGLINNDLEVITPGWLDEMLAQAARPGIGCVGAMLYYPDDTIQHAGVVLGIGGVAGHAFKRFPRGTEGVFNRARLVQNYSAVTAACLVVRKSTYEKVGGLGEKKLAVAFNDIDFCLKVQATGLRNLWTPFAELYHHESASRGLEDTPEKHARFRAEIETMLERWGPTLAADPAYNANLTLEHEDFSIAPASRAKLVSPKTSG